MIEKQGQGGSNLPEDADKAVGGLKQKTNPSWFSGMPGYSPVSKLLPGAAVACSGVW